MRYKNYIIGLVIIVGVIIAIMILVPGKPQPPKEEQSLTFSGENLEKSLTEKEPVRVEDPLSFCEQQQNSQACKDNFYYQSAIINQAQDLCSNIKDNESRQQCQEQIEKELIKEIEVCKNLGQELKPICKNLNSIPSLREGKPPVEDECQGLENSTAKQICLSMVRNKAQVDLSSEQPYAVICEDVPTKKVEQQCLDLFKAIMEGR